MEDEYLPIQLKQPIPLIQKTEGYNEKQIEINFERTEFIDDTGPTITIRPKSLNQTLNLLRLTELTTEYYDVVENEVKFEGQKTVKVKHRDIEKLSSLILPNCLESLHLLKLS